MRVGKRTQKEDVHFDIPMGSFDGEGACELVGVFIMYEMREIIKIITVYTGFIFSENSIGRENGDVRHVIRSHMLLPTAPEEGAGSAGNQDT